MLPPLGGDGLSVFFFFDGDRAGRQAALRAFGVCAEAGVWGRAAFLPEGFDPDSYVRHHGTAATLALLDAAPTLVDFYFDSQLPPGATLPQRTRLADDVRRLLARVSNDLQFELLARQAAARLGLSETVFRRARTAPVAAPRPTAGDARPRWPAEERLLIELMATDRAVADWAGARAALTRFTAADLRDAGDQIVAAWEQGRPLGDVVDRLPKALAEGLSAAAIGGGPVMAADERMRAAEDCVRRIDTRTARAQRQAIASELRRAESSGSEGWRDALADLNNELRRKEGGAG